MREDETAIARERLVGAITRERDRHLLAREFADAIGRQRARVGEGLVEHVGDLVDQRKITRGHGARAVVGREAYGDLLGGGRSEEHTYELQSLMRIPNAVFSL